MLLLLFAWQPSVQVHPLATLHRQAMGLTRKPPIQHLSKTPCAKRGTAEDGSGTEARAGVGSRAPIRRVRLCAGRPGTAEDRIRDGGASAVVR